MITVVVRVSRGAEALAATLSAVIPAVAAGLVGDAVIVSARQDDALERVADASGATLIVTEDFSWEAGARAARRDWLLCLEDGDIPQEGWIRILDRFVSLAQPEQGLARMRRERAGLLDAVAGFFPRSGVRAGDLVHRRVLLEGAKSGGAVRLPATLGRDPVYG